MTKCVDDMVLWDGKLTKLKFGLLFHWLRMVDYLDLMGKN